MTGGLDCSWLSGQRLEHVCHKISTLKGGNRLDIKDYCDRRSVNIGASKLVCIGGSRNQNRRRERRSIFWVVSDKVYTLSQ